MRRWQVSAIACVLALRAATAAAQTVPTQPAPPPPQTTWYGWQTLVTDAGAVGLFALAAGMIADHSDTGVATFYLSLGTFVFGGPIVHAAHGHWGKAGASLALRLGLPLLGWSVGFATGEGNCNDPDHASCDTDAAAAFTTLMGIVTAAALDAALIAREPAAPPARDPPIVTFTPLRSGGGLALAGRF